MICSSRSRVLHLPPGAYGTPQNPRSYLGRMVKILDGLRLNSSTFLNISLHLKPFYGWITLFWWLWAVQIWGLIQYSIQSLLGLLVRILASLGLDSSTFVNISLHLKPFYGWITLFCDFGQRKSGVDKMVQYIPVCHLPRVYFVSNSTYLYPRIWQAMLSRPQ